MNRLQLSLFLLLVAGPVVAQETPVPLRMAASSLATVEVHVNARPIGDGHPGPITRDLHRRFHALVRGESATPG